MMFQLHTAFATELIALAAAIALLAWVSQRDIKYAPAKIAGYFILVAVLLSMLCTLYYGIGYQRNGYFKNFYGPHHTMFMEGTEMMHGKKCPMCSMMENSGFEKKPEPKSPQKEQSM